MTLPSETEAGSAGMQPCRGIAWWAHRDDEVQRENHPSRAVPMNLTTSSDRKTPMPCKSKADYGHDVHYRRTPFLHFTLNQDTGA